MILVICRRSRCSLLPLSLSSICCCELVMSRWREKKVDEDAATITLGEGITPTHTHTHTHHHHTSHTNHLPLTHTPPHPTRHCLSTDFEHARPMWNAEVTFILRNYLDQQSTLATATPLPVTQSTVITDTLTYVASLNQYANPDQVNAAHELLSRFPEVNGWELAVVNNVKVDEVDECLTLLPTIRAKVERGDIEKERIEELLTELRRYQIQ